MRTVASVWNYETMTSMNRYDGMGDRDRLLHKFSSFKKTSKFVGGRLTSSLNFLSPLATFNKHIYY